MNSLEVPLSPESWPLICRWHERREEPSAIAGRMQRMIDALTKVSPVLSKFEVQLSDKPPGQSAPFTPELFERVALRRVSTRGERGRHLGYHALLYSEPIVPGSDLVEGSMELDVSAGGYADAGRPISRPQSCILDLPLTAPFDTFQSVDGLAAILRCIADAWQPDYGFILSSRLHAERWRSIPERVPTIGWLTYRSARRGPLPPFEAPASVISLGESGAIIVACPERVTIEDERTVAAVDAVEARLREAGLLYPEPDHDTAAHTIAELGTFFSTR